jgi:hypothetical protein
MANDFDAFCASHMDDLVELTQSFADYQVVGGVTQAHVRRWLQQFNAQHRELALRFAGSILYYSTHAVNGMLRELKELIDQQIEVEQANRSSVFYLPGGRTAESGPSILHRFRNMNRMQRSEHFVELNQVEQRIFGIRNPMFVFLDDFVGTGRQITNYWRDVISQIIPEYFPMVLAVIAAFREGINRIENETPFTVIAVNELSTRHQLHGNANESFSRAQKLTLGRYCDDWGNNPLGHGDIAALVSFSHGTPNNAPSIIRGSERQEPRHGILPGWEDMP